MLLCHRTSVAKRLLLVIIVLIGYKTTIRSSYGPVESSIVVPLSSNAKVKVLHQMVENTNSSIPCATDDDKPNPVLTQCLLHAIHSVPNEAIPKNLSFFNPHVSQTVHQTLLELLEVFHQTVTSHNLTYFLNGGTLLGSWRHHGFIPWDDDADVFVAFKDKPKLKVQCLHTFFAIE